MKLYLIVTHDSRHDRHLDVLTENEYQSYLLEEGDDNQSIMFKVVELTEQEQKIVEGR